LMTYIEYRKRTFTTPLTHRRIAVAPNLAILATMNPRDRSALEVDDALIRRLRIIDCPPDVGQLAEMLQESLPGKGKTQQDQALVAAITRIFSECEKAHPETFRELMPFGHGMFSQMREEQDLYHLWHQRIKHLLERPLVTPHAFTSTIKPLYVWKDWNAAWDQPPVPGAGLGQQVTQPAPPGVIAPAAGAPALEPAAPVGGAPAPAGPAGQPAPGATFDLPVAPPQEAQQLEDDEDEE
jgi:hypothetical protein